MAMTAAGRGQALFNALKSQNPLMAQLSVKEGQDLLGALTAVWGGADLTYIAQNAQINPGSLNTPAGANVSTTGSAAAQTGKVTSNQAITGLGTVS